MELILCALSDCVEAYTHNILDHVNNSGMIIWQRNSILLALQLIHFGIDDPDDEFISRLIVILLDIERTKIRIYGKSNIKNNFVSLQAQKLLALSHDAIVELMKLDTETLTASVAAYLDNMSFCNDNNQMICNEEKIVVMICSNCGHDKCEIYKTYISDLLICERCCFYNRV